MFVIFIVKAWGESQSADQGSPIFIGMAWGAGVLMATARRRAGWLAFIMSLLVFANTLDCGLVWDDRAARQFTKALRCLHS